MKENKRESLFNVHNPVKLKILSESLNNESNNYLIITFFKYV